MQTKPALDGGGQPKPSAGKALVLGIILAGFIGLIVYELRGRGAAAKPAERAYATVIDNISTNIEALKKNAVEKAPLDVTKTLAERPATNGSLATTPAPGAVATTSPPPAEVAGQTGAPPVIVVALPPLDLKGIVWTRSNPLAIVNGMLVGVNESVPPYTVAAIEKDHVIFRDAKGGQRIAWLDKDRKDEQKAEP